MDGFVVNYFEHASAINFFHQPQRASSIPNVMILINLILLANINTMQSAESVILTNRTNVTSTH